MSKDPLKILLTTTIGILLLILSIWLVNTYVVPAIIKSRINSGEDSKIGKSEIETPKSDKEFKGDNIENTVKVQGGKQSENNLANDSEKVAQEQVVAEESSNLDIEGEIQKSETQDEQSKSKVDSQKPDFDIGLSSDRGSWEKYKGAYDI